MAAADIQLVDIEAELSRLWESRQEKDHIKACLCTLIVYTPDQDHALFLKKMVQSFIEKFPCRIIFIQRMTANEDNSLHVSVSNAIVGQGKVSIACDQISIEVGEKQIHRVSFLVLPHLVADLPIYLLWGQDPTTENDILPKLLKFATRLIFNTSGVDDLQSFSRRMRSLLDRHPNLDFMDMNWARIHGWREALSQVFDTQIKSQQLRFSKSIHISYNDKNEEGILHSEMQARFLIGWIAAQMQWKLIDQKQNADQMDLSCDNGKNQFTIALSPQINPNLPSGAILQVDVASTDNTFFSIIPMANLPKVLVYISTLEKCELPFTLSLPDLKHSSSLIKAILYYETSDHYRNMLQSIE